MSSVRQAWDKLHQMGLKLVLVAEEKDWQDLAQDLKLYKIKLAQQMEDGIPREDLDYTLARLQELMNINDRLKAMNQLDKANLKVEFDLVSKGRKAINSYFHTTSK